MVVNRNAVSAYLLHLTKFTNENNSIVNLAQSSKIRIKDKSSFFMIKAGGKLNVYGKGKITIKQGAYICIQSGAVVKLQDYSSVIFLTEGAIKGANPALFTNSSCLINISFTGSGSVINGNIDIYIQKVDIETHFFRLP